MRNIAFNAASNGISKFERRISGKGFVGSGKGYTLLIFNESMDNSINIIKSLEYSGVLIDGVTEVVNHEIKSKVVFLVLCKHLCLVQWYKLFSLVVKGITGRVIMRAGRGYYNNLDKSFWFISIL